MKSDEALKNVRLANDLLSADAEQDTAPGRACFLAEQLLVIMNSGFTNRHVPIIQKRLGRVAKQLSALAQEVKEWADDLPNSDWD